METKYHGYDQTMKGIHWNTLTEMIQKWMDPAVSEDSPAVNPPHMGQVDSTIVRWSSLGPGPSLWMPLLDAYCSHPCPERFET